MSDCVTWIKYSGYAYMIMCLLLMIFSIFITYKYIKHSKTMKLKKSSFCIGLSFYLSTNLGLCVSMLHGLNACSFNCPFSDWKPQNKLYYILFSFFYVLQYHVMLIVLLDRLYGVFSDTPFALNQYHKINFIILHSLFVVIIVISIIFGEESLISFITQISYGLLLVFIIIYVTTLFIKKLFQMFDEEMNQSQHSVTPTDISAANLVSVITKCTVLTCFSVTTSICSWSLFGILFILGKSSFYISFLLIFDMMTNLICITLTFTFANNQYHRYCGLLDKCCGIICKFMNNSISESVDLNVMKTINRMDKLEMVDHTTAGSITIPTLMILSDHMTPVSIDITNITTNGGVTPCIISPHTPQLTPQQFTPQQHHE